MGRSKGTLVALGRKKRKESKQPKPPLTSRNHAKNSSEEVQEGRASAPTLRRHGEGGHRRPQGPHRVEHHCHRQVHRERLPQAPRHLQEVHLHDPQEARRQRRSRQGQGLLQARHPQGRAKEEGREEEAAKEEDGHEEEGREEAKEGREEAKEGRAKEEDDPKEEAVKDSRLDQKTKC